MEKAKINFSDFEKIDIRLRKVEEVERVSSSKILLKIRVDIGSGTKQSIVGLGGKYDINELRGKTVAVVTNLQPKIHGMESEVMLLAALDDSVELGLLKTDRDMNVGLEVG